MLCYYDKGVLCLVLVVFPIAFCLLIFNIFENMVLESCEFIRNAFLKVIFLAYTIAVEKLETII